MSRSEPPLDGDLREDLVDQLTAHERESEPRETLEEVKRRLRESRRQPRDAGPASHPRGSKHR